MHAHCFAHDGQSEATAGDVGVVQAHKTAQGLAAVSGCNSRAVVTDRQHGVGAVPTQADVHPGTFRRVSQGVVDQVVQHRPQCQTITRYHQWLGAQQAQIGLALIGLGRERCHLLANQRVQGHRFLDGRALIGFEPGQLQQLGGQVDSAFDPGIQVIEGRLPLNRLLLSTPSP